MATQQNFDTSALENTILNILASNEKNFEYPALQKEAVDAISSNITKVIYGTLKQKSIASSTKRCNILKFLNNFCQTTVHHLDKNNYKIYLQAYTNEFSKINNPQVKNLMHDITQELDEFGNSLKRDIIDFYKRKNAKRKKKIKKLELIKQNDQEKLSLRLGIQIPLRNISYYETSESLINELLVENNTESNEEKLRQVNNFQNSREYREKKIKFCYALMNYGGQKEMKILESILQDLTSYKHLERFEVEFLTDLWLSSDQAYLDINSIITENYPFIGEKIIIQFCTDIIKLKDATEVSKYFTNLETNSKIVKFRCLCVQNLSFYCKIKSLIFELYIFSYCNANVYRFLDYII